MTEPHHDPSPDDVEAVSAHLDGEATAEEEARIEADPALQALAARMGAVREHLAVDEVAGSVAEAHIGAALDAFETGAATAPVVSLSAVRERRWYHQIPLGAVAAALVVVALIGAIAQIDVDSDDSADTAAGMAESSDDGDDSVTEESVAEDAAGAGGEAEAGSSTGPADGTANLDAPMAATAALEFATVDDLAAHITRDVLAQRTRSQFEDTGDEIDPTPDDESAAGGDLDGCDPVAAAGIEGAPLVAVVPAVVDGRAVTAVVVEVDEGRRLVVVDDVSCAVTDDRVLDG